MSHHYNLPFLSPYQMIGEGKKGLLGEPGNRVCNVGVGQSAYICPKSGEGSARESLAELRTSAFGDLAEFP